MGDLRDPQLPQRMAAYTAAARAAGIFHDKQDKYSSYGRCGECQYLEYVWGVPGFHRPPAGEHGSAPDPDFQCAYNLVSFKHRERFPFQRSARERLMEGPDVRGASRAVRLQASAADRAPKAGEAPRGPNLAAPGSLGGIRAAEPPHYTLEPGLHLVLTSQHGRPCAGRRSGKAPRRFLQRSLSSNRRP